MKKIIVSIAIILVAILGIIIFSIILKNDNNSNKVNFYFFPLQDADASLITYKETVIMIDTGEEKDQEKIQEKLQDKKISKINYLILTHPDKDHIGNAQFLIQNYQIGTIFQTDYDKGSELQDELDKIIEEKDIENEIVTEDIELHIEDLEMKIQPPSIQYEDSNNNSLIVTVEFNGRKALYAGDIREERIQEILQDLEEVDLLKYPYHGRKNELSKEFIQKIKPKMTIITGESPDEDIINELKNVGSKIRFTSIEDNAQEIIDYIENEYDGHISLIGGLSLGGQILLEILSRKNDICDYAIVESALAVPMKTTYKMIRPTFSISYGLISKKWFSKMQFNSLRIRKDLFDDYYEFFR